MSSLSNVGQGKRKRVSGRLDFGPRGFNVVTDTGELWVLDRGEIDNDLVGRLVVVEGKLTGFDRLQVDWLGETER